eukprot:GFUD01034909.1.p1 GENE.GFUD01034909.1~~GFUD01034909.1.p1  ORF type:complete len:276 (+),score=85.84 GFUD01034909.1:166-993(+)
MDLRKVPGCHVYGGVAPLAAGIAKIPKERILIFNIDSETEEALKDVPSFKVPFEKERPLPLECFDTIVKALVDEGDKTQCVFSSKGEEPSTLGMVAACAVKSVHTINTMRALVEEGITEKDWTEAIIKKTFEEPNPDKPGDTTLTKGEFDIVKALLVKLPEIQVGKILIDKMIDLAGEAAGGTHLRRCVSELQAKMDAASGEEQILLKRKLLNSLERYFYLVCFGAYCRQEGTTNFKNSFASWLAERSFIADMVENGIRVWEQMTFFSLSMTLPA